MTTKLLNVIKALKQGAIVRDYNHSPQLAKLCAVRGVTRTYRVDHTEYSYARPVILKVEHVADIAIVPAVEPAEVDQSSELMIPCAIRLHGEKFTQHDTYVKMASIYTKSGVEYYVLASKHLGGMLYRKAEDVRFVQSVEVQPAAKKSA